jgi:hypothetical protein
MLQDDKTLPWADFFRARAGKRACDVVKQYEFLTQRFEALVGKEVPMYQDRIQEVNYTMSSIVRNGFSDLNPTDRYYQRSENR